MKGQTSILVLETEAALGHALRHIRRARSSAEAMVDQGLADDLANLDVWLSSVVSSLALSRKPKPMLDSLRTYL